MYKMSLGFGVLFISASLLAACGNTSTIMDVGGDTDVICTTDACSINGICYSKDTHDPFNSCHKCDPVASRTAWTNLAFAAPCNDGKVCTKNDTCDGAGTCRGIPDIDCQAQIDGDSEADTTPDGDSEPAEETEADSEADSEPDGSDGDSSCAPNSCYIDAVCYDAGVTPSTNVCLYCHPGASKTEWTNRAFGYGCGIGSLEKCDGQGNCVVAPDGDLDALDHDDGDIESEPPFITQIALGQYHACAISDKGQTYCWGSNFYGQLGTGVDQDCGYGNKCSPRPRLVPNLPNTIVSLKLGANSSFALLSSGALWSWGIGTLGILGIGDVPGAAPQAPKAATTWPADIATVLAGFSHTCVVTNQGALWCSGVNFGRALGLPDVNGTDLQYCSDDDISAYPCSSVVIRVNDSLNGVRAAGGGTNFSCVLTEDDAVRCWGANYYYQLGSRESMSTCTDKNGDKSYAFSCSDTLTTVAGLPSEIKALAVGNFHSCVLTKSGAVWCWGDNIYKQLGTATLTTQCDFLDAKGYCSEKPLEITGLPDGVTAIAAGGDHTCALTGNGVVACWGLNHSMQLGVESSTIENTCGSDHNISCYAKPQIVTGLPSKVVAISAGGDTTCALTDGGIVACWGANHKGQRGNGIVALAPRSAPTLVVW